jgi:hypothetical protein
MLINIWVKDNDSGVIHQVGTDRHDSLEMINGRVEYYNLQNGCGTPYTYSFVEAPDADDYISITPEEMLLNKAYCDDRILESIRNRPPEETEARKKYTEECIRKAKKLTEKNGIIF